jgi:hypothetical protein
MSEPTYLGYGRGGQVLFFVVPALVGAGLGEELISLGVVVRDEGGKHHWRRPDRPVEP